MTASTVVRIESGVLEFLDCLFELLWLWTSSAKVCLSYRDAFGLEDFQTRIIDDFCS